MFLVAMRVCYRPYKQDSTDTQKGPRAVPDQYKRHGTAKPRGSK